MKNTNNENPLVSIITPVYNAEKFIIETIRSVQNQTYPHWEMILVDDCSSDNSINMIEEEAEKDSRIKLYQLSTNSGAAIARNTAIEMSQGKYIAFLDSDDLWLPHKLETQVKFMEEQDLAFTYASYRLMKENGELTPKVIKVPSQINYEGLLKNTIIGCLTVMINKEKVWPIQMQNIRTRQDFVLWLDILKRGIVAHGIQDELALYRKVEGSISSNKLKTAKRNWEVYRKIEKLPLIKAAWCFVNYAYQGLKKS
jgi:teichuronic acid biosynthesis glycosyltransferase TuaG